MRFYAFIGAYLLLFQDYDSHVVQNYFFEGDLLGRMSCIPYIFIGLHANLAHKPPCTTSKSLRKFCSALM